MTRTAPGQVAFSSGELDPLLHQRVDYQRFKTGLATCRGFLPLPQGGITRAPGTLHRGATRANAAAVLVPFVFSQDDACVLEFTPLRMRVWRYGALVLSGASPYELVTPYDAAALARLQWVQSADVLLLADGAAPVQRLARLALDSWTIGAAQIDTGPFRVQNLDEALTIQASAETGAITLTASAALFQAGHVGALFQLRPTDYSTIPLWTGNEVVTVGSFRRYGENVYELMAVGANVGVNPPQHSEGTHLVDAATSWKFTTDGSGIVRITAVASATSASATVLKRVPKSCVDDPTYRWSEGAWSALRGYPATLALVDQRLAAAATPTEPRTVWFSAVGTTDDFEPGVEADDAFAYTVDGSGGQNRIQTLATGRSGLHIFAAGEEYSARSESRAQVIGPTTAVFRVDSSIGASPARPVSPDGDPVFITRDRRRVVMIAYSLDADANKPLFLSLPAQHLGSGGFAQIVWQDAPQRMAWLRRDAGDLCAMIHDPSEEILGWATLPVAGGHVEAMTVTPDATGTRDVLTLVVRRVVNGATVRLVEELAQTWGALTGTQPITDAVHFFAAVTHDGAPVSVFSLLHLVGQPVYAWTNLGEFGPITVEAGGAVFLPEAVTRACIGLFDATHLAETLPITPSAAEGSAMGRRHRLHAGVTVGLHRTAQGEISVVERDLGQPEREGARAKLVPRQVAASLTEAFTGLAQVPVVSGHATDRISLRIRPWSGAPLTMTAIVPTVQEAGR
jgi:hypothetical protein